jgi:hypothetical protein
MFLVVLAMAAGAADAADDANGSSQRDNPGGQKPVQIPREKFRIFFAFSWSRHSLQPENGSKPFDRPARERTGCIQNINS